MNTATSFTHQISPIKPTGPKLISDTNKHIFFEAAITRLMDRLYGTALRFTRNSADAEDLIAESMEKAWNNLDKLDDYEKFDGWMMRILSNTYISNWRRQKTHDKIFDDNLSADDNDDRDSLYAKLHQPFLLWYGSPEKAFLNKLLQKDIEAALDSLPDNYRIVVVMVQLLGCSYEEVSENLDVPIGTIRSRLNRGRKQLQDALWENARDANLTSPNQGN
jgi:RNA polymerase sigma factor (sigma-70 family)